MPVCQIVAMGGGGFSMDRTPLLDDYVLSLARRRRPRVCFLPTASGDAARYIAKFYRAFPPARARASHLPLFERDGRDVRAHLLGQHVIYVGGGNTANLLAVWRAHGVDRILRSAWQRGVVLAGVSAGMLCWFECGVTDSYGPLAPLHDGLGFLPGSACPHYDGERHRRQVFHDLVRRGFPAGYAADDGVALHFVGGKLHACVSSRRGARAHRLARVAERVVEAPLATRYLGR